MDTRGRTYYAGIRAIREELKRDKMSVGTGSRAVKFKDRIGIENTKSLLEECKREMKRNRERGILNKSCAEKELYLNRCGASSEWLEERRQRGGSGRTELESRDRVAQLQDKWEKIRESRSAARYRQVMTAEIPRYIRDNRNKRDRNIRTIARLRCGNEERGNNYWLKKEERLCRICRREEENLEHLTRNCEAELRWNGEVRELLDENGRSKEWGRTLERKRESERKHREAEWAEQGSGGRAGGR